MKKFLTVVITILSILAFSISIVDDAGRLVTFDKVPKRIVSAAPSSTKFLLKLGLDEKIVGVTDWDVFNAEKIGNMVPLNIEKILSLNPDVVITFGGFQLPEVEKLEKFGIKAFVINPVTLNDIARDIMLLGNIFKKTELAKKVKDEILSKMKDYGTKTAKIPLSKRPKVFFTITIPNEETKDLWTAGTGSYINELITIAGGVNICAPYTGNNGWFSVNWEFLTINDPDVIIVSGYGNPEKIKENIKSNKLFSSLKAVKNDRILIVNGNDISSISPDIIKYLDIFYNFFYGGNK
ncbi:iron ABC transporter substrate-binding protein [Thermosipho melanesiensis]|uniref:Periplasmic binding protein n=2 Tax=Thermosipho melanesiensis TaxID=46541 RepID=A6LJ16_THEM4|nr:ABC transporter substrate-binding protein [Thermosipho melanesiensis]ABR29917.1 periplasmic binding protein [Thermosipho melanesiensis BI429]APT73125.1 iron ABC transporter substrate-binding protein [Thermosipho melanesiensis]OOC38523.1 iron ABC transporter substrate-binding protein [Thermosipho melanesiensis]OOC40327.1 iron ABC transporter substrate-binding protein [Thermosipho melanesiensis]OOC40591.1 iron ABC transporter substrate-binding protein [Thermosipho melanesiensis]